jgi:Nucleotidyl transferase AbiEii toxin, Type IV TA system
VSRLGAALQQAAAALRDLEHEWALVGGLAVSVRAEPRFTRDLDLALAVTGDDGAEQITAALIRRGFRLDALVEQEAVKRLATARLLFPGELETGLFLDLLFASSGIEPEVVADAEWVESVLGLRVRVARRGHLLALKLLSRSLDRPQDQWDVVALLKTAGPADLEDARSAVRLITERGFDRGKDLAGDLEELLAARASG